MTACPPDGSLYPRWRFFIAKAQYVVTLLIFICLLTTDAAVASTKAWGLWHRVRKGDTVWEIANKYQVSIRSILRANQIASARRLSIGKKLFIPGVVSSQQIDGTWHRIKSGDTLWAFARKHHVSVKSLMHVNNLKSSTTLQVNKTIFIPNPGATGFTAPLRVPLIVTSDYGYRWHPISGKRRFHHGVDFRVKRRYRVYASKVGTVVRAGWYGGYGNVVVIKHTGGYTTWYGHLSTIRIKVGQKVRRGQVVGLSGRSGHATGPHLHFEIRWKGKSVHPANYLRMP
jgi:murein DD-endopeptidase MepM/ murein hydrolase activator NlpD